jgi:hypothetical protein
MERPLFRKSGLIGRLGGCKKSVLSGIHSTVKSSLSRLTGRPELLRLLLLAVLWIRLPLPLLSVLWIQLPLQLLAVLETISCPLSALRAAVGLIATKQPSTTLCTF